VFTEPLPGNRRLLWLHCVLFQSSCLDCGEKLLDTMFSVRSVSYKILSIIKRNWADVFFPVIDRSLGTHSNKCWNSITYFNFYFWVLHPVTLIHTDSFISIFPFIVAPFLP
jgi:hypothetical protein